MTRELTDKPPPLIERQRAEIERLRAMINGMVEKGMDDLTMVAAFQVNEELRTEIERLKAEKINLLSWLNTHHPHVAIAWARAWEPKP